MAQGRLKSPGSTGGAVAPVSTGGAVAPGSTGGAEQPYRHKSLRNANINYRSGWWSVTVQVAKNKSILGAIVGERAVLNKLGLAVEAYWRALPAKYPELELFDFVVMPNHFHALLRIHFRETNREHHLGFLMSRFKGGTSFIYGKMRRAGEVEDIGDQLWQRDYWDDLVTSEAEFKGWQKYIRENPANWSSDRYGACTAYTFGNSELLNRPRVAFVASQGFYASELKPRRVWAKGTGNGTAKAARSDREGLVSASKAARSDNDGLVSAPKAARSDNDGGASDAKAARCDNDGLASASKAARSDKDGGASDAKAARSDKDGLASDAKAARCDNDGLASASKAARSDNEVSGFSRADSVLISTFTSAQEREALRRALAKKRPLVAVFPAGIPDEREMAGDLLAAIRTGWALAVSPQPPGSRLNKKIATWCNEFLLKNAGEIWAGDISPNGMLAQMLAGLSKGATLAVPKGDK